MSLHDAVSADIRNPANEITALRKALTDIAQQCHDAQYVTADEKLHRQMWKAVETLAGKALL